MLVAFVGKARSGKDTAADYLREKGVVQEKDKLARWLKDVSSELFGIPLSVIEGLEGDREALFERPKVFTAEHFKRIRDEVHPTYHLIKGLPLVGRHLFSVREILQFIGSDVVRSLDSDFHVKNLAQRLDPRKVTAVTDVRFENELRGLKQRGALTVYVYRPHLTLVGGASEHVSEKVDALAKLCDVTLVNDGSKEEYLAKLDLLAERITNVSNPKV